MLLQQSFLSYPYSGNCRIRRIRYQIPLSEKPDLRLSNSSGLSSSKATSCREHPVLRKTRTTFAVQTRSPLSILLSHDRPGGRQSFLTITSSPRFGVPKGFPATNHLHGKSARFHGRVMLSFRLNPYVGHYSRPFAFSGILYPLTQRTVRDRLSRQRDFAGA